MNRKTGSAPRERTIYVAAVEAKGGVTVNREPFPLSALPSGGGYILKKRIGKPIHRRSHGAAPFAHSPAARSRFE